MILYILLHAFQMNLSILFIVAADACTTKTRQLSPSWQKISPLSSCIISRWKTWRDSSLFSSRMWLCSTCVIKTQTIYDFQKSLPNLEKQISQKRVDIQGQLDKYGRGPPTEPCQRNCFLIDVSVSVTKMRCFTEEQIKVMSYWFNPKKQLIPLTSFTV